MKKYLYLTLGAISFAFLMSSCEPEEVTTDDDNSSVPACRITQLNSSSGDSEDSDFSYNSSKQLTKISSRYAYESCFFDGVEEICEEETGVDSFDFTYDNEGRVSQVRYTEVEDGETEPDFSETVNFTYTDGILTKLTIEEYPGDELRLSYTNNKLVKMESVEGGILFGYIELTWTGENVTRARTYYESEEGGRKMQSQFMKKLFGMRDMDDSRVLALELERDGTFSDYDDKNNPFEGNLIYAFFMDGFYFLGKNNVGRINQKQYWEGTLDFDYTLDISFQYNDQGFPTQYSFTGDDGDTGTFTLSYDCD